MGGLDVDDPTQVCVTPLHYTQPSRIAVELDINNDKMNMLRLEGIDANPMFNN